MMKKRDEVITAAVQAVIDATRNMPGGSLVTWEFIEQVTDGFNRHTHPKWTSFRSRLLKEFPKQRNGAVLFHLKNGGWTILTPAQQLTDLPLKRTRKAGRQLAMTAKAVGGLNDHKMPVHLRAQQARVIEQTKNTQRALRRQRKQLSEAVKTPTQNPMRPRPEK